MRKSLKIVVESCVTQLLNYRANTYSLLIVLLLVILPVQDSFVMN